VVDRVFCFQNLCCCDFHAQMTFSPTTDSFGTRVRSFVFDVGQDDRSAA